MFTAAQKYACAIREFKMRQRVYTRLVNVNARTRDDADRELAMMREIADDYEALAKKERLL